MKKTAIRCPRSAVSKSKRFALISFLILILSSVTVFAQTGLFTSQGGTSFASLGITVIIIFFVIRQLVKKRKGSFFGIQK